MKTNTTNIIKQAWACSILPLFTLMFCAACLLPAAQARAQTLATAPVLHLETFFNGPLTATGFFQNNFTGEKRTLTVVMTGSWTTDDNGTRVGRLVEDFSYTDGEKDKKTWVFTKLSDGHYTGTREDVLGTADILDKDGVITLDYVTRQKLKHKADDPKIGLGMMDSLDLTFHDTIVATSQNSVRNTALVSLIVLTVGAVDLTITKVSKSAKHHRMQTGAHKTR